MTNTSGRAGGAFAPRAGIASIIDTVGRAAPQYYLGSILLILLPWIPSPAISPF